MSITYEKTQRDLAKSENQKLFTLAITHKGGKPYVSAQGPASQEDADEIEAFIFGFLKRRAERAEKN